MSNFTLPNSGKTPRTQNTTAVMASHRHIRIRASAKAAAVTTASRIERPVVGVVRGDQQRRDISANEAEPARAGPVQQRGRECRQRATT